MWQKLRIERLTNAIAVFGVLLTLPFISALTPAALFVPEYPGENPDPGREGGNDVFSMSHELRVPLDPASGLPSGSVQHGPLYITKIVDNSTPGFYKALGDAEQLAAITLNFYRTDQDSDTEEVVYSIELKNVRIISIESALLPEDGTTLPRETVGFAYQQVIWTWIPTDATTTADWSPR